MTRMQRSRGRTYIVISLALLAVLLFFGSSAMMQRLKSVILFLSAPMIGVARESGMTVTQSLVGTTTNATVVEREERATYQALSAENERLRNALDFAISRKLPITGAEVVFYGRDFEKEFIVVNTGDNPNIQVGQFVVDEFGFAIGAVKSISGAYSRVDFLSNAGETFEAMLSPARVAVLVDGKGARSFTIRLIPKKVEVSEGDVVSIVVNKGGGRALMFGEITDNTIDEDQPFQEASALLIPRPELLREVYIVMVDDPTKDEKDAN